MSNLTMPSVNLAFRQAGSTAMARSQKGTVALLLRDAALADKTYTLRSTDQIPATLGAANKAAVRRVFLGYVHPPKAVLLYVMDAADVIAADSACLTWLATQQFDYLAGPDDLTAAEATVLKTWIVTQRTDNHAIYKAVLPKVAADSEGIINVATDGSVVGTDTFAAEGYCGRIAGLLAGTPMKLSATYAPLPEVEDVTRLTPAEMDAAVGAGKFIWWWDGSAVKTGRAVNSLTTVTGKSDAWKKIKIVELLDMVQHDVRKLMQDSVIGKYPNSYASKQLVVTFITDYLSGLAKDELIGGDFSCGIDVEAHESYLQSQGVATADMTEQQIKEANTGTHVFLKLTFRPIDAMEDVSVTIYL